MDGDRQIRAWAQREFVTGDDVKWALKRLALREVCEWQEMYLLKQWVFKSKYKVGVCNFMLTARVVLQNHQVVQLEQCHFSQSFHPQTTNTTVTLQFKCKII